MWNVLIAPVANLFSKALDLIDKYIPDKDLAAKLKAEMQQKINEIASNEFLALLEARSKIVLAEVQGESWLQRNWRPLLMAEFGVIIGNNYIIGPILHAIIGSNVLLPIPPDMWALLKLGLTGYVVGRSAEKIADGDGVKGVLNKILNGTPEKS